MELIYIFNTLHTPSIFEVGAYEYLFPHKQIFPPRLRTLSTRYSILSPKERNLSIVYLPPL